MKYSDTPIFKKEEDLLNRRSMANELASAINQYNLPQSYVLGVNGKWGDGKTSLINLCHEEIKVLDKDTIEVIYFNPWYFTGEDQILKQFCNTFSKHISTRQGSRKELKKTADKIVKIAECIKPFKEIANVAGLTLGFPLLGNVLDGSADRAAKYAQTVSKGLDSKEDISELKKQIGEELEKTKKKFLIIIDDIDRLQDDEVSEIFRLVKVVADFSNTVYLLAYDREQVASALNKYYHSDGDKFIEKIIQQEVPVNHIHRDTINKILIKKIQEILKNTTNEENYRFQEIWDGLSLAFSNVRDVKRFVNSYSFLYSHIKNEVNPVDLLAVVALQIKAPEHHKFLRDFALLFITKKSEDTVAQWNDFIEENGGEKDWRSLLLNLLLPSASETTKIDSNEVKQRSFSSKNHVERYFTFTIAEGETSEAEYKLIMNLSSVNEITSYFTEFDSKGMLSDLIEGIRLRALNFETGRIPNYIISLLDVASENREEKSEIFGFNIRDTAFRLAHQLFGQLPDISTKKDTLDKTLTGNGSALFIQVRLLDYFGQSFEYVKQRGKHRTVSNDKIFLTQEEFEIFKTHCLEKLSNLNFIDYLDNPYFVELCYDLDSWGERSLLTKILQQIDMLPDAFLHFAELSQIYNLSTGPKQLYKAFKMNTFKFLTRNDNWSESDLIAKLKPFEKEHSDRVKQIMMAISDAKD